MAFNVERQTLGFASSDGKSQIKGLLWQPEGVTPASPRGIVQIVHGMSEHVGRYEEFARHLAAAGYVVCGHDHIGHGKSAPDAADHGHMPVDAGKDALVEDVHALRTLVSGRYARSVPYVLFGHSMGSFVVRNYLTIHAQGLAGAVLCGTGNQPLWLSKVGNALARFIAGRKGERAMSPLLHSLADGAFSKAVPNARTPFDWLSANEDNVDAYIADELSGFQFTVGGYATLTALTRDAARLDLARNVPPGLPLLYIAGDRDPVGNNGAGVRSAADLMRRAGVKSVDVRLYAGMRHEILNETGKQQVFDDVLAWVDAVCEPRR